MSALHDSYLHGLNRLMEEVKAKGDHARQELLEVLQLRLAENLEKVSFQRDTRENESQRFEVLQQLNKITGELYDISFYGYCQLKSQPPSIITIGEKTPIPSAQHTPNIEEEVAVSGNTPALVQRADTEGTEQQTNAFFLTVKAYLTTLHTNVQKAQEVFNSDTVSQEQCEEALSSFYLFDCSNLPDYNPPLYRAKTRLQYFNQQVNRLRDFCEICDDVDRPSKTNIKKIQEIIGILNPLLYDVEIFLRQFNTIDMTISQEM